MTAAPASPAQPVTTPRRRERLLGSDALRAVATVWVIVIHASAWGPGPGYADAMLIARFSVPVFTVLTGLLLAYQYTGRPLGRDFIRARMARTVVPWLAWVPVYLALDIWPFQVLPQDGGQVSHWVSEGGGHLWYLLLIPQLYVVFALWPRRRVVLAAVIAMAVQTMLALWHLFGPLPSGWVETLVLNYGYILYPFWIGYFAVGVALGRVWRPLPAGVHRAIEVAGPVAVLITCALLLTMTFSAAPFYEFLDGTGGFLNPILPLFVFSITAWVLAASPALMRRSRLVSRVVSFISDYSLGIYIIHPIILYYAGTDYAQHLQHGLLESIVWFLLICAACFCGALAASRVIAATPLAAIIGMRRRPLHLPSHAQAAAAR